MTLTFLEAQAALAEIKYKPDWSLALTPSYWDPDSVIVWATIRNVVDARGRIHVPKGCSTTLMLNSDTASLRGFPNKEAFQRWVFKEAIRAAEEHEMGEWFTVNGERWYDPHRYDWPRSREKLYK